MYEESGNNRCARIHRITRETDVCVELDVDGSGFCDIATGVPFLDHMLDALGRHSLINLSIDAKGDVEVDDHHTVEDVGIVLGQAVHEALGEAEGITRFGQALVPMDESLVMCALDISGRGRAVCDLRIPTERVGSFDTQLAKEFFEAFAAHAGITLHIRTLVADNSHHIIEAAFKALARALKSAVARDPRVVGVPSTKGNL